MISTNNTPLNEIPKNSDFTTNHYKKLINLALKNFEVVQYNNIQWSKKFVLWRHDIDFSLNRALDLAKIEMKKGMKATYFINPHSEFYNISELSQYKIIKEILDLGHSLGLHFDSAFYQIKSEQDLEEKIKFESTYLETIFDVKPVAFSFHNPITENFKCEKDYYGGLINCYSKKFKKDVSYCSDSNGYWRFHRLYDILFEAKDSCLQVLTHPAWWQEKALSPYERIKRCVDGRRLNTLEKYEKTLKKHGRPNFGKL